MGHYGGYLNAYIAEQSSQNRTCTIFPEKSTITTQTVWSRWKSQFFLEMESFIPRVQQRSREKSGKPPWFNNFIRHLIRTKNRLFKRARSSRLPEQWAIYRSARNKATNAIKMAKANHFNRMASSLANPKCQPSKWWNMHVTCVDSKVIHRTLFLR